MPITRRNQPAVQTNQGFQKLMSFYTPPDGEPLTAEQIELAKPTPEVFAAAERLTPDELSHLFIDVCGSFEVTHPDYRPPGDEVYAKAGQPLIDFFNRVVALADEPQQNVEVESQARWLVTNVMKEARNE